MTDTCTAPVVTSGCTCSEPERPPRRPCAGADAPPLGELLSSTSPPANVGFGYLDLRSVCASAGIEFAVGALFVELVEDSGIEVAVAAINGCFDGLRLLDDVVAALVLCVPDVDVAASLVADPAFPDDVAAALLWSLDDVARAELARNEAVPANRLAWLCVDRCPFVLCDVAGNVSAPPETVWAAVELLWPTVRVGPGQPPPNFDVITSGRKAVMKQVRLSSSPWLLSRLAGLGDDALTARAHMNPAWSD